MKSVCKQIVAVISLVIFCAVLFTACSSSNGAMSTTTAGSYDINKSEMVYATTAATTYAGAPGAGSYTYESDALMSRDISADAENVDLYNPADGRKLIRNASINLQSERYDESLQAIQSQIAETGSYIESSNTSGTGTSRSRYLQMTIRVPADKFDAFMSAKDSFGVVQESNVWSEDVTFQYTDMEARLETLNAKRERLLALLEKATKMTDIIELESALTDTIYQIEQYTSSLTQLDNRVAYCSVNIYLSEVYKAEIIQETPKTLGQRISQRFDRSVTSLANLGEDLLVFVIGASPVLLLLAVVVAAIIVISMKVSRGNRKKYEAYLAKAREQAAQNAQPGNENGETDQK